MRLNLAVLSLALSASLPLTAAPLGTPSPFIVVDQFGYLPDMSKIAVLRDPVQGYDAAQSYQPASSYEIRDARDNKVVLALKATAWKQGAVHDQKTDPRYQENGGDPRFGSGDRIWHLDFSSLSTVGSYYIYDPSAQLASYPFDIRADVYNDVFRAAFKSYFYQRFNQEKSAPFAAKEGQDAASHEYLKTEHEGVYHINDCWAFQAAQCADVDHFGDCAYQNIAYIYEAEHPQRQALKKLAKQPRRDMSGGWYDAGDYNKYVLYSDGTINELLYTYEEIPAEQLSAKFWDTIGIPESGNGINDLLDEIKWELDWLLKMQITAENTPNCEQDDRCGLFNFKHSAFNWGYEGAPSQDETLHCYASPTLSATIAATNALAHAAVVYKKAAKTPSGRSKISHYGQISYLHPTIETNPLLAAYAKQLQRVAQSSWERLKIPSKRNTLLKNPQKADFQVFKAYDEDGLRAKGAKKTQFGHTGSGLEDDSYVQIEGHKVYEYESVRLMAAIFLYAGINPRDPKAQEYHQYIKNFVHQDSVLLNGCGLDVTESQCKQGYYLQGKGINAELQEALFYYANLPQADSKLKKMIENAYVYAAEISPYNTITPYRNAELGDDPYMAFIDDYTWGSNAAKSRYAILLLNIDRTQIGQHSSADYHRVAAGYLHYLHGVNPLSQVYLSNMSAEGAENSVMHFYHLWFNHSDKPASGYLVGGANQFYSDSVLMPNSDQRLEQQPRQKAFKAFNDGHSAYEITENAIYYQAPYLRLLRHFMTLPQKK